MSRLTHHRKITAIAVVAVLMAAAGAYAYWTQAGSGTGSATTATTTDDLVIEQTTSVVGLAPGGAAQALSGTIENTSTGTVRPASVTASLVPGDLPSGCVAADFTINNPTTTLPIGDILAGATGNWSGPTIQMNNTAVSQDGCKADTLVVTYTSL